jgi:hypothetical protein
MQSKTNVAVSNPSQWQRALIDLKNVTPVSKPMTKEQSIANTLIRGDSCAKIQRDFHCRKDQIVL